MKVCLRCCHSLVEKRSVEALLYPCQLVLVGKLEQHLSHKPPWVDFVPHPFVETIHDHLDAHSHTLERVSSRVVVVVVVVRKLFSLVTSVICVQIRSHRSCYKLRGLFTTQLKFSFTSAFLPQWIRGDHFHFILLRKHSTFTFLCRLASYACMRLLL